MVTKLRQQPRLPSSKYLVIFVKKNDQISSTALLALRPPLLRLSTLNPAFLRHFFSRLSLPFSSSRVRPHLSPEPPQCLEASVSPLLIPWSSHEYPSLFAPFCRLHYQCSLAEQASTKKPTPFSLAITTTLEIFCGFVLDSCFFARSSAFLLRLGVLCSLCRYPLRGKSPLPLDISAEIEVAR